MNPKVGSKLERDEHFCSKTLIWSSSFNQSRKAGSKRRLCAFFTNRIKPLYFVFRSAVIFIWFSLFHSSGNLGLLIKQSIELSTDLIFLSSVIVYLEIQRLDLDYCYLLKRCFRKESFTSSPPSGSTSKPVKLI